MIKSFADKTTRRLFEGAAPKGFPRDVKVRALDKLAQLNTAERIEDMAVPRGTISKPSAATAKERTRCESGGNFGFVSCGKTGTHTTWR